MTGGKATLNLQNRTAIIAGNGDLPVAVANAIEKQGSKPFIIALRGETDSRLYRFDHCEVSMVQLARLIKALKTANVGNVILAGGVKSRPLLSELRPDFTTLKALPKVFKALGQGDNSLLLAFIQVLESHGFHVVGAHEVVPQLLAPCKINLTTRYANTKERHDIMLAATAAKILGQLDVGQGAVAVRGRVVAVEGAEGTDNMLKRISEMRVEQRIPLKGGVLVKRAKPQQDERADLPTIGPSTIIHAFESGLDGVAIEAERSFILSLQQTIETADERGMFIETFGETDHA